MTIGVFSDRQPGRLPDDFDNKYAWVQILAPKCQEPVQMKLKIQMKHLKSIQMKLKIQMEPTESIQMEPIESIQVEPTESIPMEPIKSIEMKLIILGNFWAFLLIVRVLLIKLINQNAQYYCCLIILEQFCCFSKDSI